MLFIRLCANRQFLSLSQRSAASFVCFFSHFFISSHFLLPIISTDFHELISNFHCIVPRRRTSKQYKCCLQLFILFHFFRSLNTDYSIARQTIQFFFIHYLYGKILVVGISSCACAFCMQKMMKARLCDFSLCAIPIEQPSRALTYARQLDLQT